MTTQQAGPKLPTGTQAAQQAGITYRQLDHWTRMGYIEAEEREEIKARLTWEGSGHPRYYRPDQVEKARLMGELHRELGFTSEVTANAADAAMAGARLCTRNWMLVRLPDTEVAS